jgi:transposase
MPRTKLTDEYWLKLKPILLDAGIYDKPNLRMTFEGMLYRIRVGGQWRDLPKEFGNWNSIFKRFNEWSKSGKLMLVFKILSKGPDLEWEFIDGSIVKAHQHSSGAAKKSEDGNHGIGKSVAGNTSKIHLAVDSSGNPIDFEVTGGEVHDAKVAPDLIAKLPPSDYLIADRGYDSEPLREQVREKKGTPIIPRKKNSKTGNDDIDWDLYKCRHLVENAFAKLKHYRGIATRFDKLKRNFLGALTLVCSYFWLPL